MVDPFAATPTARKILGLDGNPIDVIDDHNYPFTGTYQVKMRVATIGLIWAFVTASPVLLSKDGNLRNQCISLCCKSLTAVSRMSLMPLEEPYRQLPVLLMKVYPMNC